MDRFNQLQGLNAIEEPGERPFPAAGMLGWDVCPGEGVRVEERDARDGVQVTFQEQSLRLTERGEE